MSPLSCAQLFKSRVKGGHRQLDKQPTPRQIASLFGAPLANMLHMFRGSLAAGAILFFFVQRLSRQIRSGLSIAAGGFSRCSRIR